VLAGYRDIDRRIYYYANVVNIYLPAKRHIYMSLSQALAQRRSCKKSRENFGRDFSGPRKAVAVKTLRQIGVLSSGRYPCGSGDTGSRTHEGPDYVCGHLCLVHLIDGHSQGLAVASAQQTPNWTGSKKAGASHR
jgi:hypothetical protein